MLFRISLVISLLINIAARIHSFNYDNSNKKLSIYHQDNPIHELRHWQPVKTNITCEDEGTKTTSYFPYRYFECKRSGRNFYFYYKQCNSIIYTFYEKLQKCAPTIGGGIVTCVIPRRPCPNNILGAVPFPNFSKPNYYLVCLEQSVHICRCPKQEIFNRYRLRCTANNLSEEITYRDNITNTQYAIEHATTEHPNTTVITIGSSFKEVAIYQPTTSLITTSEREKTYENTEELFTESSTQVVNEYSEIEDASNTTEVILKSTNQNNCSVESECLSTKLLGTTFDNFNETIASENQTITQPNMLLTEGITHLFEKANSANSYTYSLQSTTQTPSEEISILYSVSPNQVLNTSLEETIEETEQSTLNTISTSTISASTIGKTILTTNINFERTRTTFKTDLNSRDEIFEMDIASSTQDINEITGDIQEIRFESPTEPQSTTSSALLIKTTPENHYKFDNNTLFNVYSTYFTDSATQQESTGIYTDNNVISVSATYIENTLPTEPKQQDVDASTPSIVSDISKSVDTTAVLPNISTRNAHEETTYRTVGTTYIEDTLLTKPKQQFVDASRSTIIDEISENVGTTTVLPNVSARTTLEDTTGSYKDNDFTTVTTTYIENTVLNKTKQQYANASTSSKISEISGSTETTAVFSNISTRNAHEETTDRTVSTTYIEDILHTKPEQQYVDASTLSTIGEISENFGTTGILPNISTRTTFEDRIGIYTDNDFRTATTTYIEDTLLTQPKQQFVDTSMFSTIRERSKTGVTTQKEIVIELDSTTSTHLTRNAIGSTQQLNIATIANETINIHLGIDFGTSTTAPEITETESTIHKLNVFATTEITEATDTLTESTAVNELETLNTVLINKDSTTESITATPSIFTSDLGNITPSIESLSTLSTTETTSLFEIRENVSELTDSTIDKSTTDSKTNTPTSTSDTTKILPYSEILGTITKITTITIDNLSTVPQITTAASLETDMSSPNTFTKGESATASASHGMDKEHSTSNSCFNKKLFTNTSEDYSTTSVPDVKNEKTNVPSLAVQHTSRDLGPDSISNTESTETETQTDFVRTNILTSLSDEESATASLKPKSWKSTIETADSQTSPFTTEISTIKATFENFATSPVSTTTIASQNFTNTSETTIPNSLYKITNMVFNEGVMGATTPSTTITTTTIITTTGLPKSTIINNEIDQFVIKGEACPSSGKFRYKNSCKKYYYCDEIGNYNVFIKSHILDCGLCTQFNAKTGMCDVPENVNECQEDNQDETRTCTGIGSFSIPFEEDCRKYYECNEDNVGNIKLNVRVCPTNYVFNHIQQECIKADTCLQTDITQPTCEFLNYNIADAYSCTKYYHCNEEGQLSQLNCDHGYIFNGEECELKSDIMYDLDLIKRYII